MQGWLPKTVLIADNDESRAIRLAHMMRRFGYNVFASGDKDTFYRLFNGIAPEAVLLYAGFPWDAPGGCLASIRSISGPGKLKVITYGEKNDSNALNRTLLNGANAMFTWPVAVTDIFAIVQRLIEATPRRVPRLRALIRTRVDSTEGSQVMFATSLSEYGVFIHSLDPMARGTKMKLALDIPANKPLEVAGEVIYVAKSNPDMLEEPGMGVLFSGMDRKTQYCLRGFIENFLLSKLSDDLLI
ncbi:MAG: hypothetical protein OEV59_02225 [Deltaproteobacteria bacterium]|nr:hypothetical protein [Deltaproteobacteria bacterium]